MSEDMYQSIVHPRLEYGNLIWGLHYKLDQQAVEIVQRRATKLCGAPETLCEAPETVTPTFTLPRRRRDDMIDMFKIMTGTECIDPDKFFKRPLFLLH